jgi:hypothetical protein
MVVLGALSIGCSRTPEEVANTTAAAPQARVVAFVNDSPITDADLENLGRRLGMNAAQASGNSDAEAKLLESLVGSRAMAIQAEATLSAQERRELDLKVSAYREELLVQRYLQDNAVAEPVSADLVESYYQTHPEEFGGGAEKSFELLRAPKELSGKERNDIIRKLAAAGEQQDWGVWAQELGDAVTYKKGSSRVDVLEGPLKALVRSTGVGEVSPIHTGQGVLVVRVLEERQLPPRPLSEVRSTIRKKLAPLKLKEAIKKVSEDARKQVVVRYQKGTE